jgi:metal-responsive CopG/Arc/MetJ family transcriptional regulator
MEFWRRQMPTDEIVSEKRRASHIVKVTGMSEELLGLLDARVKQQQATGRAEYIRELIRRDALASLNSSAIGKRRAKRHKARRGNSQLSSEQRLLEEYHALVDLELESQLSPEEQARLRVVEGALDRIEARETETQAMFARLEETAGKLDALLAAVRALPQAEA